MQGHELHLIRLLIDRIEQAPDFSTRHQELLCKILEGHGMHARWNDNSIELYVEA